MAQAANENPPLIVQFENRGYHFVLDLHTNRLFSLDSREAALLGKWVSGTPLSVLAAEYPLEAKTVAELQGQGLFCRQTPAKLAFGAGWDAIFEQIMHARARTVLEITQQCNLRCKYCTFGGGFRDHRVHSAAVMAVETVEKAIDEAFAYGDSLEEISIGFYGGEPLLPWERFKAAVRYAQSRATRSNVRFSLTTNATLVDEEKARFLKEAGFSVLVSLDGPRCLHDLCRVYPDGRGSYADTIRGLRCLLAVYPPEMHERLGINMVIPSYAWMTYLEKLWDEEPWLPRTIRAQAAVVSAPEGFSAPEPPRDVIYNGNYRERWLDAIESGAGPKTTLGAEVFDKGLAKIHQRPIFHSPRRSFFPNGCCIPGIRKVYVQAGGAYQICERVHGAPTIGAVGRGVDRERVRQIVEEYSRESFQDCRSCSAISLCTLCFMHAYENGRFNIEQKRAACSRARRTVAGNLAMYGLMSRVCPHKLAEWDKMVIL